MTTKQRRLAAFLAGLVVVAVAAILSIGVFLTRPAQVSIGKPPADLAGEDVSISGGSGADIHGWYSPGRPGVGAVLLLHPVRGNRTSMLGRARFLHRDGYTVLLIDLQAHGETVGQHITFGAREALDARAAVAYLRARAPSERVAAIGWSIGGAAALLGPNVLPVDALILEAVYPTIEQATADRLRIRLGVFGPPLAPLLLSPLGLLTGARASELRPIDAVARVRAPLLVIAGARDPRTTLPESQRLFDAATTAKELWIVPNAGHDDYHATHRAEYEARVGHFLQTHLALTQQPK